MELASKEFIHAINSKSVDRQFQAFAEHQVLDMKYFFSTEEVKRFMTHGSRKIENYKDSMNHQNALRVMIMMQMMKMIINIKI